jgi:ankyrin repeat protein
MSEREVSGRPDLSQYRKLAKDLLRAQRFGELRSLERIKRRHPRFQALDLEQIRSNRFILADAQLVIARELSFPSWPKLVEYITTIHLIQTVGSLHDPVAAFIEVACVPRHAGHGDGTLQHAEMILARYPEVRRANIHTSAILGDEAVVRQFLAANPASVNALGGPHRWDALTHLCFSRYLRIERERSDEFVGTAKALLDAGASPDTGWFETMDDPAHHPRPHQEFESVLYGAATVARNADLTRLLLERGGDPNDAETAYHVSESYDNTVMQVLLESGKFSPETLVTLLVRKADLHDIPGMKLVLEHGGNPNWTPMWGSSALLHALLRDNRLPMIELLLDFGAEMNVRSTRYGLTGYQLAARRGRGDVLEMLERRGIALQLDPLDQVIAACASGDRSAATALVAREPEIREELVTESGKLLSDFAGNGNLEGVQCLLDLGAQPNSPYGPIGDGYWDLTPESTPLHVAAWRGHPSVVKELIARGAHVNVPDGKGRTPLMLAVKACVNSYWMERRTPDSVAALLAAGAKVDGIKVPCGYDEVDTLLRQYGCAPVED